MNKAPQIHNKMFNIFFNVTVLRLILMFAHKETIWVPVVWIYDLASIMPTFWNVCTSNLDPNSCSLNFGGNFGVDVENSDEESWWH